MRIVLIALLVLVGMATGAVAEPADPPGQPGETVRRATPASLSCLMGEGATLDASTLFLRTYGPTTKPPEAAPPPETAPRGAWLFRPRNRVGVSGRHVEVLVQQPIGTTRLPWESIELIAAARVAGTEVAVRDPEGVFARFVRDNAGRVIEEGGMAVLRIDMPALGAFWVRPSSINPLDSWEFVVALCNVNKTSMIGWADYGAHTGSTWLIAAGTVALLAFLAFATLLAACMAHHQILNLAWQQDPRAAERPTPPLGWRLARMLNPTALTQTAEGEASLGRFQILVFTFVVIGVLLVVFFSTFSIPVLSEDILALLGITALGTFGARVAANAGSVSTVNVSWLTGKGIIARRTTLPRFTDLMIADGEVDLTRVQALFFTLLVGCSLVFSGTADLAGFTVPAQTMQLLGLSQLTYVAGKAIPAESVRRLNAEIDALRAAERQVIENRSRQDALAATAGVPAEERLAQEIHAREGLAQAETRWVDARAAAESTLESIYGERFNATRLRAIRP